MKLIDREYYLKKLINVMGTPDIKIITGVRRCGKSKLLEQLNQYIKGLNDSSNVISINLNESQYKPLRNSESFEQYVDEKYKPGVNNFLLVDEIQRCEGFEEAVNSLYETGKFDMYLTGSNAFLSSSDLATLFVGRQYEIELYPFSLTEFMRYYNI